MRIFQIVIPFRFDWFDVSAMDKERFTERILETENLTDELEDTDANWLLDWGITRLDLVLKGAKDDETAGSRVNALMAVMRKINRITGSYSGQSPQMLAGDLSALHDLFVAAFGPQDIAANARSNAGANASAGAANATPAASFWKSKCWPWAHKKRTSKAEPPVQPSFESTAARLSSLSSREVLEYLANQFYPTTSPTG